MSKVYWEDMTVEEREQLRRQENPQDERTGHYTGRCAQCGSTNLWDDCTAYGCNACGAIFMVG